MDAAFEKLPSLHQRASHKTQTLRPPRPCPHAYTTKSCGTFTTRHALSSVAGAQPGSVQFPGPGGGGSVRPRETQPGPLCTHTHARNLIKERQRAQTNRARDTVPAPARARACAARSGGHLTIRHASYPAARRGVAVLGARGAPLPHCAGRIPAADVRALGCGRRRLRPSAVDAASRPPTPACARATPPRRTPTHRLR